MSRRHKLTPDVHKSLCESARKGLWMSTAATNAGVHRDSVYEWLKVGGSFFRSGAEPTTDEQDACLAFYEAFTKAEAEFEEERLAKIGEGGKEWKAYAWHLERRYPDRYGSRQRVEMEHSGSVSDSVKVVALPPIQNAHALADRPAGDSVATEPRPAD